MAEISGRALFSEQLISREASSLLLLRDPCGPVGLGGAACPPLTITVCGSINLSCTVTLPFHGVPSRQRVVTLVFLPYFLCLTIFVSSSLTEAEMVHSRSSFGQWKHAQRCNRYRSSTSSSTLTAWNYVAFDVVPPAPPPPDFLGVGPLSNVVLEDAPITRTDCSFITVQWGVRLRSIIRAKQTKEAFLLVIRMPTKKWLRRLCAQALWMMMWMK